jgi:hypothetical protein
VPVIEHLYGLLSLGTSACWWGIEQATKLLGDGFGFTFEASICDADRPVASRLAGSILGPVALEGSTVAMRRVAVELDYQALAGPKGVYLMAENIDIGGRGDEVVFPAKEREALLQIGARPNRCPRRLNKPPNRPQRPSPVATGADAFERPHFQQPKAIGLFKHSPELGLINHFGHIEESASNRGDRNTHDYGPIVPVEAAFVDDDAWSTSAGRRRHFDWARAWPSRQSP